MKLYLVLGLLVILGICLADPITTSEEKGSTNEDTKEEIDHNRYKRSSSSSSSSGSSSSSSSGSSSGSSSSSSSGSHSKESTNKIYIGECLRGKHKSYGCKGSSSSEEKSGKGLKDLFKVLVNKFSEKKPKSSSSSSSDEAANEIEVGECKRGKNKKCKSSSSSEETCGKGVSIKGTQININFGGGCKAESNKEVKSVKSRHVRGVVTEPDSLEHRMKELYQNKKLLKRVVRSSGMSDHLPLLESTVISHCKATGNWHISSKLQNTFDRMMLCIRKKTIYVASKEEYLANLEECSRDSVKQTQDCFTGDQKYFPEFILDLSKSVVSLLYDDRHYMLEDLGSCLPKFNEYSAQRSYVQCVSDVTLSTRASSSIPMTKAEFCQQFIPVSQCFTNLIRDVCDRSTNLDQFREDYIGAIKRPCDKKE